MGRAARGLREALWGDPEGPPGGRDAVEGLAAKPASMTTPAADHAEAPTPRMGRGAAGRSPRAAPGGGPSFVPSRHPVRGGMR